jgi:hypothetical protein
MAKPEKDVPAFAHIEALVAEEHRLFEHEPVGGVWIELGGNARPPRGYAGGREERVGFLALKRLDQFRAVEMGARRYSRTSTKEIGRSWRTRTAELVPD